MPMIEYNASTHDIITYLGDYGNSLTFKISGALINDNIVFCFDKFIDDMMFTCDDPEDFTFDFEFNNSAVQKFSSISYGTTIPYSVKHYRNGELLSTIWNANLILKATVRIHE